MLADQELIKAALAKETQDDVELSELCTSADKTLGELKNSLKTIRPAVVPSFAANDMYIR